MIRALFLAVTVLSLASALAGPPPTLKPGNPAPDFTVNIRKHGKLHPLKLSEFRGKSHLVVVFGRAHW